MSDERSMSDGERSMSDGERSMSDSTATKRRPYLPHRPCTVCSHSEVNAINAALKAGESVRKAAKRFGVSPAAIDRHKHHDEYSRRRQARVNPGHISHIDDEIKKLIRERNRAKKRRDAAGTVAIARELRNWFILKQKAEIASIGPADANVKGEELSRSEALALAKAIIDGEAHDPEVLSWLETLLERARATGNLPEGHG
jgi:transposase-like protein